MRIGRVDPPDGVEAVEEVGAFGAVGAVRAVETLGTIGTVRAVGTLCDYGEKLGVGVPFERRSRIRCLHFWLGK